MQVVAHLGEVLRWLTFLWLTNGTDIVRSAFRAGTLLGTEDKITLEISDACCTDYIHRLASLERPHHEMARIT